VIFIWLIDAGLRYDILRLPSITTRCWIPRIPSRDYNWRNRSSRSSLVTNGIQGHPLYIRSNILFLASGTQGTIFARIGCKTAEKYASLRIISRSRSAQTSVLEGWRPATHLTDASRGNERAPWGRHPSAAHHLAGRMN
jgi:hypothetical protein